MKRSLPLRAHTTRIENRHGGGVPDLFIQWDGVGFWVELKVAKGSRVLLSPEQVVWHLRQSAAEGRSYVLVKCPLPPYLRAYPGSAAPLIASEGLSCGRAVVEADTPAAALEALRTHAIGETLAALRPHAVECPAAGEAHAEKAPGH